jgi:tetratricopeptide (TPR) repeat protein
MSGNESSSPPRDLLDLLKVACEPAQYQAAYDRSKLFLRENTGKSDAHYLFAYACYGLSYTREELSEEAIQAFKQCLQLGPTEWDRQMTFYHLGFLYFRQGAYRDALGAIAQRDPAFFDSIGQFWRIAKLDEVELACRYYLDPQNLSVLGAEELKRQYARFDESVDAPLLLEIGDCLSHLLEISPVERPVLNQICAIILSLIVDLDQVAALRKRKGAFFAKLSVAS